MHIWSERKYKGHFLYCSLNGICARMAPTVSCQGNCGKFFKKRNTIHSNSVMWCLTAGSVIKLSTSLLMQKFKRYLQILRHQIWIPYTRLVTTFAIQSVEYFPYAGKLFVRSGHFEAQNLEEESKLSFMQATVYIVAYQQPNRRFSVQ
jgi:hypothetical protein